MKKLVLAITALAFLFVGCGGKGDTSKNRGADVADTIAADTAAVAATLLPATGESHEYYPREIDCIVGSYIAGFADWREVAKQGTDANPLFWLLADKRIDTNQIISYRQFKISRGQNRRDCFWVEIWKMRTAADAEKLRAYCGESVAEGWDIYLYYPPKAFYAFENYLIWVNACSFAFPVNTGGELGKIRKMCFE